MYTNSGILINTEVCRRFKNITGMICKIAAMVVLSNFLSSSCLIFVIMFSDSIQANLVSSCVKKLFNFIPEFSYSNNMLNVLSHLKSELLLHMSSNCSWCTFFKFIVAFCCFIRRDKLFKISLSQTFVLRSPRVTTISLIICAFCRYVWLSRLAFIFGFGLVSESSFNWCSNSLHLMLISCN